jgi:hypothetical protein
VAKSRKILTRLCDAVLALSGHDFSHAGIVTKSERL